MRIHELLQPLFLYPLACSLALLRWFCLGLRPNRPAERAGRLADGWNFIFHSTLSTLTITTPAPVMPMALAAVKFGNRS